MANEALVDVLTDFAKTMVTDSPMGAILDYLVTRVVNVVPVSSAGVTLISATSETYEAVADETLPPDAGDGPSLLAYRTGEAVAIPDLTADFRFPAFTACALDAGVAASFSFPLRHRDHQLGTLNLYRDTAGGLSGAAMSAAQTLADVAATYLQNAQDRQELQDSSHRSRQTALHDALTGLPNRVLTLHRLEEAFARSGRTGKAAAVLFVDLDGFKTVNDTFGHAVGDELLVAVGHRLSSLLRASDLLGRFAGDEFVVVCEDLDTAAQAAAVAARLEVALSRPFLLSGRAIPITASIGIAFGNHDTHTPEQLLHDADAAMYQAKRQGHGRQYLFLPHDRPEPDKHRGSLARDLHTALDSGDLYLEYQPIVSAADGGTTGFEALLRWAHPTLGPVPPTRTVPLAEQAGLTSQIARWVLTQAGTDQQRWIARTGCSLTMAVNVSAHQLMETGFTAAVAAVLKTSGAEPHLLTLEIPETVFLHDLQRAVTVLTDLKNLGVKIALDNFGAGYCSLSHLKRLPADVIKIHRSFVADLDTDLANHSIVQAVVQLGHGLGMTVNAHGVETTGQHHEVEALGCDFSQGFYFARPMPANQIDQLIDQHPHRTELHLPPARGPRTVPQQRTTTDQTEPRTALPPTFGPDSPWRVAAGLSAENCN